MRNKNDVNLKYNDETSLFEKAFGAVTGTGCGCLTMGGLITAIIIAIIVLGIISVLFLFLFLGTLISAL